MRKLLLFFVPPSQFKSLKIKFCHNFSTDRQILLIMSGGLCRHPALRSSQQRKVGRSVPCPHKQQPGGRQVRSDQLRSLLSVASERKEKNGKEIITSKQLAWDQVLHWGKTVKKTASKAVSPFPEHHWAGFARRCFSYLTLFFAFFHHCGAWSKVSKQLNSM